MRKFASLAFAGFALFMIMAAPTSAEARGSAHIFIGGGGYYPPGWGYYGYPSYYYVPPPPVVYVPPPAYYAPAPAPAYAPSYAQPAPAHQAAGTFVDEDGQTCRPYHSKAVIEGKTQRINGTVCLQPDGSWQIVR